MRMTYSSNGPWEDLVGYSRAVAVGNHLYVSGTTAANEQGEIVSPGDVYAQAHFILERIRAVLEKAGFRMADVVQTRMYLTDISRWSDAAKAHRAFFGEIRPAATMVEVSRLIHPDMLIEIEVIAHAGDPERKDGAGQ
jgi:enamine deaminase RidA (YjgF/YER057c/UK114 family)